MFGRLIIPVLSLAISIGYIPLVNGVYQVDEVGYGAGRLGGISWGDYNPELKAIAGHGYGWLASIDQLQAGDQIVLVPDYGPAEEYSVFASLPIAANDFSVLNTPPTRSELVLYRCWGDGLWMVRAMRIY